VGRDADIGELTSSGEGCLTTLSRLSLRIGQAAVAPEWVIVDAVTAVEVHVDKAIAALVAESEVSDNNLGSALLGKYGEDMTKNWPARYEWLADGFGLKIKGQDFVRDFDVAIDCRNAIVHGSGQITKKQRSNFNRFTDLRRRLRDVLSVDVYGIQLVFSGSSAKKSLSVSSAFIYGFDRALKQRMRRDF
jgi:hypothetical protein